MKTTEEIYRLPDCKVCGNTRRVKYTDRVLGERWKTCGCMVYQKRLDLLRSSKIPEGYLGYEFEDYRPEIGEDPKFIESNRKTLEELRLCVDKHDVLVKDKISLYIYGEGLSGKTLLSTVVLKSLILQHGYRGVFVTGDELLLMALDEIKLGGSTHGRERRWNFYELEEADFMLLDGLQNISPVDKTVPELVRVFVSDFVRKRIFSGKPMIVTGNQALHIMGKRYNYAEDLLGVSHRFKLQGKSGHLANEMRGEKLGFKQRNCEKVK